MFVLFFPELSIWEERCTHKSQPYPQNEVIRIKMVKLQVQCRAVTEMDPRGLSSQTILPKVLPELLQALFCLYCLLVAFPSAIYSQISFQCKTFMTCHVIFWQAGRTWRLLSLQCMHKSRLSHQKWQLHSQYLCMRPAAAVCWWLTRWHKSCYFKSVLCITYLACLLHSLRNGVNKARLWQWSSM